MIGRRMFIKNGTLLFIGSGLTSYPLHFNSNYITDKEEIKYSSKMQILSKGLLEDYVRKFNADDNEIYIQSIPNDKASDFLEKNIPFFECPDKEIEKTYYFRWWTFRKHLKETADGWVITEFLPAVAYAGKHNTICCPAGHHISEGRWLHSEKNLDDYSLFWLRKGGDLRSYSFWVADSIWKFSLVKGDFSLAKELLPDLVINYLEWEKSRQDPNGLYWQIDVRDGMEVSIGGSGYRATINSYQYGDAMAIANIAELSGQSDLAETFREKAFMIRDLMNKLLWDESAEFYKVGLRTSEQEPSPAGILSWMINNDANFAKTAIVTSSQSANSDSLNALKNSKTPGSSADASIPRMTLFPRKGQVEWVQYEFEKLVSINSMQVYWSQDGEYRLPREWRAFYRKNNSWHPVPARVRNRIYADTYNSLPMDTITTNGLRLEIICQGTNQVKINHGLHLADVRELHGYTPWYFDNLTDESMAIAWKQLMDSEGFYAPFGPTTAEQRHRDFKVAYIGHACQWNGPSWPFSTSITLTGLANLLNGKPQNHITKADYFKLLRNYALSHRKESGDASEICWIDENLDPFTGEWLSRNMLQRWGQKPMERGKDYNHSTFCDLIINGLIGIRPQADNKVIINPLVPDGLWDWFCLDRVRYHGRMLTVLWDKTGDRYRKGQGMIVIADGRVISTSVNLKRLELNLS